MKQCRICLQELDAPEFVQYHDDCKNCIHCGNEVGRDVIESLIAEQVKFLNIKKGDVLTEPLRVYHRPCENDSIERSFKTQPVVITQEKLDYLNRFLQMMEPRTDLDPLTNQKLAESAQASWIHEMKLEEIFLIQKRHEAMAAACSILTSKKQGIIDAKLSERKLIAFREMDQANERIEFEKERIRKREKDAIKLDPKARAREKAIEGLMKMIGMTREQAIATIESKGSGTIQ